jgi:Glycosyl hydrolase catalytic core
VLGPTRLIAGLAAVGCIAAVASVAATAGGEASAGRARLVSDTAAHTSKKGVSVWTFSGVDGALSKSGASWYYTWGLSHQGTRSPAGVRFVPMIWGAKSVTRRNLRQARREGPYLLGFNEPDNGSQSNMTAAQALALWPRLMATHLKLGSPAVASDAATPGSWLDQFMKGARADGYRVNFIAVHWYGGDFATRAAVHQLESYLRAIHARYHLPIWLTEFALIRFGSSTVFPSARQQAGFVTAATSMLQRLKFVQRYAWFALPATAGDGTAGLFRPGALATRAGRAFEAVRS